MCPAKLQVPAYEWYGDIPESLGLPDGWRVREQRMRGHDARPLTPAEVEEALQRPVGSPTLRELAGERSRCAIVFDDMTRPTKTWQVLRPLLDELHGGGISDDRIVFVMATGAHGARMLQDFRKKLGEDIPERFYVFSHNPYENLVDLGETSNGTPVAVNREVMSCDLKIAVGGLLPHFGFGFGGGAKILLPGVSGIESIWHNHNIREGVGPGRVADNLRRLDAEEAARIAGLDFIVNVLINADRDVAGLVCGDVVEAHRAAVELGRRHYATPVAVGADISIGNGYPIANEGYKAYHVAVESVREGGDLVFLLYTPEGCRVHYYNGRFGTDYGGRGWRPDTYIKKPWKMSRVLVVSPHMTRADEKYYGEGSLWVKSWREALDLLEAAHGPEAEVALYPCASIQIAERHAGAS